MFPNMRPLPKISSHMIFWRLSEDWQRFSKGLAKDLEPKTKIRLVLYSGKIQNQRTETFRRLYCTHRCIWAPPFDSRRCRGTRPPRPGPSGRTARSRDRSTDCRSRRRASWRSPASGRSSVACCRAAASPSACTSRSPPRTRSRPRRTPGPASTICASGVWGFARVWWASGVLSIVLGDVFAGEFSVSFPMKCFFLRGYFLVWSSG